MPNFYNKSSFGLAAVELAILVSIFLTAIIIFGSIFIKIKVADKENEYLYTFNSLPNPSVYEYGLEGELKVKDINAINQALNEMQGRIKFGTRGGESCLMAFQLNMNNSNQANNCSTSNISIENNAPLAQSGVCNCDPQRYLEQVKNSRNSECFNPQIVFVSTMPAENNDDSACKIYQIYPGTPKKYSTPFIIY